MASIRASSRISVRPLVIWPIENQTGQGVGIGAEFHGTIQRPAEVNILILEENLAGMTIRIDPMQGRATAGMCASVADDIAQFRFLEDLHDNPALVEQAIREGMGGYSSSEAFRFSPEQELELPRSDRTFQQLIEDSFNQRAAATGALAQPGAITGSDWGRASAGASTDPASCDVTPPANAGPSGACRTRAALNAMMEHEDYHHESCEAMRPAGTYPSEYLYWINHPNNLALDESAAYRITIEYLESWYDRYCE